MINHALHLASLGFRVFPVKPGTKGQHNKLRNVSNQLLKSWTREAATDPDTIKKWWSRWPDANVCLIPGPKAVVLDVDDVPESYVSVKKLQKLGLPKTSFLVRTPRNGYHMYFAHPGGGIIGNDSKEWLSEFPGINVRADSGYVVGPGSSVGGKEYVEILPKLADSKRFGLPALPPIIISKLPYKSCFLEAPSSETSDAPAPNPYIKLPKTIPVGTRDSYFWGLACSLVARGYDKSLAIIELQKFYKRCAQPADDVYTRSEVEAKLHRAFEEYGKPGRTAVNLTTGHPYPEDEGPGLCGEVSRPLISKALCNWVYISATNEVADLASHPANAVLKLDNFKNEHRNKPQVRKNNKWLPLTNFWMHHEDRATAHDTLYYPSKDRLYTRYGKQYYNTYVPTDLKEIEYVEQSQTADESITAAAAFEEFLCPFRSHLGYLFLDDQERMDFFMYWMAFTIRYPATRIPWAPVIVSDYQGTGKGWIYHLFKILAGPKNVYWLGPADLTGNRASFNEWLGGTVLVVDEMSSKVDFYETLKPIITETSNWINAKYGKKEFRDIFCNVVCFSNHEDSLRINKYDRRFWINHTSDVPKPPEYYTALFNWLKTDGPAYLLGYLNSLDLSNFKWSAPPPVTEAKERMMDLCQTEIEQCVTDSYALMVGPFECDVITTKSAYIWAMNQCHLDKLTPHEKSAIGKLLHKFCARRLPHVKYTVNYPTGKRYERLILIRNHRKWLSESAESVASYYLKFVKNRNKGVR